MQHPLAFCPAQLGPALESWLASKDYNQVFVLMDKTVQRHCYPIIKPFLKKHKLISVAAGEVHKNLETCSYVWQILSQSNASRKDLLINLGGGVISDLGGFCAATYKRGIDFVQIPTTLLAMADASTGGKTGIDFMGFKNQIGLFAAPQMVWIDTQFLKTLPQNQLYSGFSEILKHALIADKTHWQAICRLDIEQQPLEQLLDFSIKTKQNIVAQDPHEQGARKLLNFGHTIGHAIESYFLLSGQKPLLHGYAIAMGMIAESWISVEKGLLDEQELSEIEEFIFSVYGRLNLKKVDLAQVAKLCLQDKKNQNKKILATLLNGIGHGVYDQQISQSQIIESFRYYMG